MPTITEVKFPHFKLVSVHNPSSLDLDAIGERWNFSPQDVREVAGQAKRTRLTITPESACLVTLWPTFRRSTREIHPIELSFFIRADALVVIVRGSLPAYAELLGQYATNSQLRESTPYRSPTMMLVHLLNQLYAALLPMVDHLIDDCDAIEREIFTYHGRHMISDILAIRRNITDVRKILQAHRNVLKRLVPYLIERTPNPRLDGHHPCSDLADCVREEWDTLENLKERIEALQQSNESQISFRVAEIMKRLTIISVFTFPLTLVAALFSVWQTQGMPFRNHPGNFWYVIGIEVALATLMFVIFKLKRWF